jgi:hypothetical protein
MAERLTLLDYNRWPMMPESGKLLSFVSQELNGNFSVKPTSADMAVRLYQPFMLGPVQTIQTTRFTATMSIRVWFQKPRLSNSGYKTESDCDA